MNTIKSQILGTLALAGAWCAQAESVSYLDPVFDSKGAVSGYATKSADCTAYGGSAALDGGWYVVKGSVSALSTLTVNGDVKIILADGATLTVNGGKTSRGGLRVEGDKSLTVYAREHLLEHSAVRLLPRP